MATERIVVTIDAAGRPTMSGEGFVGKACDDAMLPFEQALAGGGDNMIKEYKPEYKRAAKVEDQEVHQRNW